MQSYSQDLRERVLRALARGDRPTDISRRFEVSRVWVHQVSRRLRDYGLRKSFQIGGHRVSRVEPFKKMIHDWIKEKTDLTLVEIVDRLKCYDVIIKPPALCHQLIKWGLSYKKNSTRQRARTRRRSQRQTSMDSKPAKA